MRPLGEITHRFTRQLREAVTRFMARHLLGKDLVVREIAKLPDFFDDNQLKSARESGSGPKTVREAVGAKEHVRIEQPVDGMGVKVE